MSRPRVIVLSPVKNEDWVIRISLATASHFADNIIVADQGSTDATRAICREFPKVTLIDNPAASFNEPERQSLLIEEARRRFPGPRLLMTLDADDIVSGNILEDKEWEAALQAAPGVPIQMQNVCLYNSPYEYRTNRTDMPGLCYLNYAMVDNNRPHSGPPIHSPHLPYSGGPPVVLHNVVSMHYQFVDVERAMAKQRWYLVYEWLRMPDRSAMELIQLYRLILWDVHAWRPSASPAEWTRNWEERGIRLEDVARSKRFWWTWEVLRYFKQYGERRFAPLPIWDYDWETARQEGLKRGIAGLPERVVRDPRPLRMKFAHSVLQKYGDERHQRHLQRLRLRRVLAACLR